MDHKHNKNTYYCSGFLSKIWDQLFDKKPPFESCCHLHDHQYQESSINITRKESDAELYRCIAHDNKYRFLARFVFMLVRAFGWKFFKPRDHK